MIDWLKLTEVVLQHKHELAVELTSDELDTVAGWLSAEVMPNLGRGYQF